MNISISCIIGDTLTNCLMICTVTECIETAFRWSISTYVSTNSLFEITMFKIGALVVAHTSWCSWLLNTFTERCYLVAMISWAYTSSTLINYETTFKCAYTTSRIIDLIAIFSAAWYTITVDIHTGTWWTHTISIHIWHKSFVNATNRNYLMKREIESVLISIDLKDKVIICEKNKRKSSFSQVKISSKSTENTHFDHTEQLHFLDSHRHTRTPMFGLVLYRVFYIQH